MTKRKPLIKKYCLFCKIQFTGPRNKKFCCAKHKARYNTRIRYSKIGQTEEYKQKAKKIFNNWVAKNPEKFKEIMRKQMKEKARTKKYKRKQELWVKNNRDRVRANARRRYHLAKEKKLLSSQEKDNEIKNETKM